MADIIREVGGYRVLLHGPMAHPTTIVSFQARNAAQLHPTEPRQYGRPFVPETITNSDIPANFISILVNRNSWYLDDAAAETAQAVRALAGNGRIVSYGSSMGGFAAINLAGHLKADYTLALSPLSTLFAPFTKQISDRRYAEDAELLENRHDFLGEGALIDQRGAVFFDSWHAQDAAHAARIASLTRMELVGVPYSGHPCGQLLNRLYPLRNLLNALARGEPDLAAIKRLLAQPTEGSPILGSDARTLPSFIARAREDLSAVDPVSMRNAAFLGRSAIDAGIGRAEVIGQLKDLVDLASDPDFPWGGTRKLRVVTLRNICLELRNLGEEDYANAVIQRHLPKVAAERLLTRASRPRRRES